MIVIGAGFGGLAAALELAHSGAHVALFEALKYPGGCASTFTRGGARFESGATLFSGFGEGQLFHRWIAERRLPVRFVPLDPVVELRAPGLTLAIPSRREVLVDRLCALPGAPVAALRGFFEEQRRIADTLWALFDEPALLPPFGVRALLAHVGRTPRYLPLLRWLGRPLRDVLVAHRVDGFAPLRLYVDAVSQITVQTSADEAEACFALATMDYYFRGTGHVAGGIGELAGALLDAIRAAGADVQLATRVQSIAPDARDDGGWTIETRAGKTAARALVANLLPHDVRRLARLEVGRSPTLDRLARRVETGWGAAMRYLVVAADAAPPGPHHLELVADPTRPFVEGNHLFCSISGEDEQRAPAGRRTVTISTHVPIDPARDDAAYFAAVHDTMRATLRRLAPELLDGAERTMTASPRTFDRFTGRARGYVGGVPRRAGLENYRDLFPVEPLPGLHLVGDTVFPGQSTLATALGGVKLAQSLRKSLAER
ncbi:MAG: NAD(P)/FAD-dependent oxidoreductase [Polyangiales bacterium]